MTTPEPVPDKDTIRENTGMQQVKIQVSHVLLLKLPHTQLHKAK